MDTLTVAVEPYEGPGGRRLVPLVQAEYVERYGGPDETPVDPAEFAPPAGLFLVAYDDGEPVACGGFRTYRPGIGEVKRMYVAPPARGRGLARRILASLEDAARAAGCVEMRLETGQEQPEAIALYTSSDYAPTPKYGFYRCAAGSRCYAKPL